MERGLPAPAIRLFRREAGVFVPSFIEKLVRTVCEIAPGERRYRIDHLAESNLRQLHLFERIRTVFQVVCHGLRFSHAPLGPSKMDAYPS